LVLEETIALAPATHSLENMLDSTTAQATTMWPLATDPEKHWPVAATICWLVFMQARTTHHVTMHSLDTKQAEIIPLVPTILCWVTMLAFATQLATTISFWVNFLVKTMFVAITTYFKGTKLGTATLVGSTTYFWADMQAHAVQLPQAIFSWENMPGVAILGGTIFSWVPTLAETMVQVVATIS